MFNEFTNDQFMDYQYPYNYDDYGYNDQLMPYQSQVVAPEASYLQTPMQSQISPQGQSQLALQQSYSGSQQSIMTIQPVVQSSQRLPSQPLQQSQHLQQVVQPQQPPQSQQIMYQNSLKSPFQEPSQRFINYSTYEDFPSSQQISQITNISHPLQVPSVVPPSYQPSSIQTPMVTPIINPDHQFSSQPPISSFSPNTGNPLNHLHPSPPKNIYPMIPLTEPKLNPTTPLQTCLPTPKTEKYQDFSPQETTMSAKSSSTLSVEDFEFDNIDTINTIDTINSLDYIEDEVDKVDLDKIDHEINEILSDPINFSPKKKVKKKKVRKSISLQDCSSKFSVNSKFSIIIENEELKRGDDLRKGKSMINLTQHENYTQGSSNNSIICKTPSNSNSNSTSSTGTKDINMKSGMINFSINPKRRIKR